MSTDTSTRDQVKPVKDHQCFVRNMLKPSTQHHPTSTSDSSLQRGFANLNSWSLPQDAGRHKKTNKGTGPWETKPPIVHPRQLPHVRGDQRVRPLHGTSPPTEATIASCPTMSMQGRFSAKRCSSSGAFSLVRKRSVGRATELSVHTCPDGFRGDATVISNWIQLVQTHCRNCS